MVNLGVGKFGLYKFSLFLGICQLILPIISQNLIVKNIRIKKPPVFPIPSGCSRKF